MAYCTRGNCEGLCLWTADVGFKVKVGVDGKIGLGSVQNVPRIERTTGDNHVKGWSQLRCGVTPAMSYHMFGLESGAS